MPWSTISVAVATALGSVLIGGGLYEYLVVDPFWPKRPDLLQPGRGGIVRGRFWVPAHTLFELVLIVSLIGAWKIYDVRFWLLHALVVHAATRIWSAFYFIPRALAFEKAASVDEAVARKWTRLSKLRFPLELLTLGFLFRALYAAIRIG